MASKAVSHAVKFVHGAIRQQTIAAYKTRTTAIAKPSEPLTLAEFVQESWVVLEPGTPLAWNWHIDAMCEHIQETLMDWLRHKEDPSYVQRIQNLLINVPPGSLKSRTVSVCAPAWFWTICPSWRVIFLSANPRVALRDSVYCRDLVESDWYQKRFRPEWQLRVDTNAKSLYWNTAGGQRASFGFNSRITGDRGDCLDGSTLVEAEYGKLTIQEIFNTKESVNVWSFNHATGKRELQPVVSARKVRAKNSLKIATGDRREIKCTDDHRIWTNRGYVKAIDVRIGDSLLLWSAQEQQNSKAVQKLLAEQPTQSKNSQLWLLRQRNTKAWLRRAESSKSREKKCLLLSSMPNVCGKSSSENACLSVPNLQNGDERASRTKVLFQGLYPQETTTRSRLPFLSKGVFPSDEGTIAMQSRVRFKRALCKNDWHWEPTLQDGDELLCMVRCDAPFDTGAGQESLHNLHGTEQNHCNQERSSQINTANTSHQRKQGRQHAKKPDNSLRPMPLGAPRLRSDAVSRIEHDCDITEYVYDIQVARNNNFFANEILVHNCIMVDDPLDAEEANSDVIRQGVNDRWDSAIRNRVNDLRSSVRIGIMQRLHQLDWSGHVLQEGDWTHLCIPQEFEAPLPLTPLGWVDPRTAPGSLMFEERFPEYVLDKEKLVLGTYGYAGQHQQKPAPSEGGMFKLSKWRVYVPSMMPKFNRMVLSCDAAFKGTQTSDYVVVQAIGQVEISSAAITYYSSRDSDNLLENKNEPDRVYDYYLPYQNRARVGISGTETMLREAAERYPEAFTKLIEDKANGPAIIERLSSELSGVTPFKPGTDSKRSRAWAIQPIHERGGILLPASDAVAATLESMGKASITVGEWWDLHPPAHKTSAEHAPVQEWCKALIDEFAQFPNAANDDQVDALDQGIIWMEANRLQKTGADMLW